MWGGANVSYDVVTGENFELIMYSIENTYGFFGGNNMDKYELYDDNYDLLESLENRYINKSYVWVR